jgi:hypothetical protein
VTVGTAAKQAKKTLPPEGTRWDVTVKVDNNNEDEVTEPWLIKGGVPCHDVEDCSKPGGLKHASAQGEWSQKQHTVSCIKERRRAMQQSIDKARKEGAKERRGREEERAAEERAAKLPKLRTTKMDSFFSSTTNPVARPAAAAAPAATAATSSPAAAPPAAATPAATPAEAAPECVECDEGPASKLSMAAPEHGDSFDRALTAHFDGFQLEPVPAGIAEDDLARMLSAAVHAHVSLLRPCPGVTVDLGGHPAVSYPFAAHAVKQRDWTWPTEKGVIFARGRSHCTELVQLAPGSKEAVPCKACAALPQLTDLIKLQADVKDPNHVGGGRADASLSHAQMCMRRDMAVDRRDKAQLNKFNKTKALDSALRFRSSAQRVFRLVADNKMPRLHQLFHQALSRGATPQKLQELLTRCARGDYSPKGYDRNDHDSLILVQRWGGGRLTYALNKSHGLASRSRLYHSGEPLPRFLACPAELEMAIVKQNIESFIFSQPVVTSRCLWTLMADNVALDERWRYSQRRNMIYGGCREHTPGGKPLFYNSSHDAHNLKQWCDEGKIHLAKEAAVFALASNTAKGYHCRPVLAQGSCKKDESWEQHATALQACAAPRLACPAHVPLTPRPLISRTCNVSCVQAIEKFWYGDPRGYTMRGPISNASSDGAGIFRQAAVHLYQREKMPAGPVLDVLKQCVLFDLWSGTNFITDDTDAKHDGKCWRSELKSPSRGILVVHHTFYAVDWRRIFSALGHSEKAIDEMLEPEDAQDVPAMVLMFKALAALIDVTIGKLSDAGLGAPAALAGKAKELQLIGAVAAAYVFLLTGFDKSITEHLANLAEMQFVIFVLQRRNGTKFLPGQNYSNTSSMIRAKFKSVALAQAEGIKVYYIFLDCDDALEGFFGQLRTLQGSTRNFDLLQLEEKASSAMQTAEVGTEGTLGTWGLSLLHHGSPPAQTGIGLPQGGLGRSPPTLYHRCSRATRSGTAARAGSREASTTGTPSRGRAAWTPPRSTCHRPGPRAWHARAPGCRAPACSRRAI